MARYCIREIQEQDYNKVVEIYNSNQSFLLHHLGVEFVDKGVVIDEVVSMKKMAFCSCVIVDETSNTILVPFWEKLGFHEVKNEQLKWGNKTSLAVDMRKNIQG